MKPLHRDLVIHRPTPLNAETPLSRLRSQFITATDDFYVRTHGDIPQLNDRAYRLTVTGNVSSELQLGLEEIKNGFALEDLPATLQCAGNRRSDMSSVRPVLGEAWGAGAIGTAVWTGASLAAVLRSAGISQEANLHVAFEGADEIVIQNGRTHFGGSIPIEKALRGHVLLAYSMNAEPLQAEHGGPLRVIVPGYAGARSVKWLTKIRVQDRPSSNFYQQRDYKLFPASMRPEAVDYDQGMIIYEMPLNSAICEPASLQTITAGRCKVRGYAIAGERIVSRVEVSINGGREWLPAKICAGTGNPWTWIFWKVEVDIPGGTHELAVRAWDSAGQTQLALPDDAWNFKGYLCASWHRVWIKAVT
jgi:sulfite oxidase